MKTKKHILQCVCTEFTQAKFMTFSRPLHATKTLRIVGKMGLPQPNVQDMSSLDNYIS